MPEEDEEVIKETSKLSEEVRRQLAGEVKESLQVEMPGLVSKELERMRPGMENRISAETSDAINALNYRLAQHGKKIDDLSEVILKREEPPAEEIPEEEPPVEEPAEEPPEEKPPEEKPEEEAPEVPEEKPEEAAEEEPAEEKPEEEPPGDLEAVIGHCVNCSLGFSEEDKAAGFKKCPECGRVIEWD